MTFSAAPHDFPPESGGSSPLSAVVPAEDTKPEDHSTASKVWVFSDSEELKCKLFDDEGNALRFTLENTTLILERGSQGAGIGHDAGPLRRGNVRAKVSRKNLGVRRK